MVELYIERGGSEFGAKVSHKKNVTLKLRNPRNPSQFEAMMSGEEQRHFARALKGDVSSILAAIEGVDVRNAEATDPADQERILGAVEDSVGADELNEVVKESLRDWVAGCGQVSGAGSILLRLSVTSHVTFYYFLFLPITPSVSCSYEDALDTRIYSSKLPPSPVVSLCLQLA